MYNQIYPYFQTIFSKFQCGFRKGFNAQHCLLAMVEKRRKTLDGGGETGAVLTDLSKAFDCIDHNSLIAKLNACGFEKQSLNFTGVNLEGRLNFDFQVNTLLKKASKKCRALARVCNYMNKKNDVFS